MCVNYCQKPDTNCDAVYTAFCGSKSSADAKALPVCGCFMPASFYGTYNQALSDAGLGSLLDGPGGQPPCNYAPCSLQTAIRPYAYKTGTGGGGTKCPDLKIAVCASTTHVDNYGNINGGIDASTLQNCGITEKPPPAGGGTAPPTSTLSTFITNNLLYIGIGAACLLFFIVIAIMVRKPHRDKRKHALKHHQTIHTGSLHPSHHPSTTNKHNTVKKTHESSIAKKVEPTSKK